MTVTARLGPPNAQRRQIPFAPPAGRSRGRILRRPPYTSGLRAGTPLHPGQRLEVQTSWARAPSQGSRRALPRMPAAVIARGSRSSDCDATGTCAAASTCQRHFNGEASGAVVCGYHVPGWPLDFDFKVSLPGSLGLEVDLEGVVAVPLHHQGGMFQVGHVPCASRVSDPDPHVGSPSLTVDFNTARSAKASTLLPPLFLSRICPRH
jgi:hypothetical protein